MGIEWAFYIDINFILLILVLISLTAYMVISPDLCCASIIAFPDSPKKSCRNAFLKTSSMLIGWMRANLIGGTIEGVSVIIFLNIMNVPGAWL
jgi:predicted PurR-regulated permease PerM